MVRYTIDKKMGLEIQEEKGELKDIKMAKNDNLLLAKSLNLGYYIVTPLLVGVFVGVVIDRFLKTGTIFTFSFIFFGVVGTFYNLYKTVKKG